MCFYCGEPTSFEHCFAKCEKLQENVDLDVLLSDSDSIKTEFEKLRRIYDQTVFDSLQADCTGKKLTLMLLFATLLFCLALQILCKLPVCVNK